MKTHAQIKAGAIDSEDWAKLANGESLVPPRVSSESDSVFGATVGALVNCFAIMGGTPDGPGA